MSDGSSMSMTPLCGAMSAGSVSACIELSAVIVFKLPFTSTYWYVAARANAGPASIASAARAPTVVDFIVISDKSYVKLDCLQHYLYYEVHDENVKPRASLHLFSIS